MEMKVIEDDPMDIVNKVSAMVEKTHPYEYDLFVIGGGSGGISAARHASQLGKKVALADFVKPSPAGSTWGLGGTCVNVGCIPKKLMHYAAILADARKDQELAGIAVDKETKHDWPKMVMNVQKHIKSLNWGYKSDLIKLKVKYFNAYASFVDAHTVQINDGKNAPTTVTADKIVVAVGGRPSYPGIPGDKEFGITSDDIFMQKKAPGKTLVIGASYVALECAGFLTALGYDTTVMVRSILLRGFDQDMANRIGQYMSSHHTKFIEGATPSKLERPDAEGPIKVTYKSTDGEEKTEEYDTVLFAMGRYAVTEGLNLEAAGLKAESNWKLKANADESTSVDNIYAVGDVIYGQLELTPVAIKAGQLLSYRLFGGKTELMDYINVPTTVFTPLEYGACGYAEEDAQKKWGEENIEVYHTEFKPLEWSYNKGRPEGDSYVKIIVNKADNEKVVGFHMCAPNAGEVTQGFGLAVKLGVTKEQFDSVVGIHPTIAEDAVGLSKTKRSDPVATKGGC